MLKLTQRLLLTSDLCVALYNIKSGSILKKAEKPGLYQMPYNTNIDFQPRFLITLASKRI